MTPIEKLLLQNQLAILRCLRNMMVMLDMETGPKAVGQYVEEVEKQIVELEKMYKL